MTKEFSLYAVCLVFLLLASGFFLCLKSYYMTPYLADDSVINVITYPDTMMIDGNHLKIKAKDKKGHNAYLLHYDIKTEEEKKHLLMLDSSYELLVKINKKEIMKKRNLNGFDYEAYIKKQQIKGVYDITEVLFINKRKISFLHPLEALSSIRTSLIQRINSTFLPTTQAYMKQLLFGMSELEYQEVWRTLGLAHLFALSGLHVTFFKQMVRNSSLKMGVTKEVTSVIEIVTLLLFMGLTGFSVGVVRETFQELTRRINKRQNLGLSRLDCLSIALLGHTFFFPTVLLSIGGQLSYYLSLIILFISPLIKQENKIKETILFQSILSFFSLPIACFYFYEWNGLVFILSLIITPILFQILFPVLVISFLLSRFMLDQIVFLVEYLCLLFHNLGEKLTKITLTQFTVGTFPVYILLLIMFAQFLLLIKWEKMVEIKVLPKFWLVLFLPLLLNTIKYLNPQGIVAFVDVGQGDAIFVQLPFHQGNYLVDTGGTLGWEMESWKVREKSRDQAYYTLIPFLKSKGVNDIDCLFITHAHEDHFGSMNSLSDEINIKQIITPVGAASQSNLQKSLLALRKSKITSILAPKRFQKNGVVLDVLLPNEVGNGGNDDSLVMKLRILDTTILLTGDLEKVGEEYLINLANNLSADILKVGHHGSKTSSTSEFIKQVSPSESVISCGLNNRFNHPSEETLITLEEAESKIYRTDQQGMIYKKWVPWKKEMFITQSINP